MIDIITTTIPHIGRSKYYKNVSKSYNSSISTSNNNVSNNTSTDTYIDVITNGDINIFDADYFYLNNNNITDINIVSGATITTPITNCAIINNTDNQVNIKNKFILRLDNIIYNIDSIFKLNKGEIFILIINNNSKIVNAYITYNIINGGTW